MYPQDIEIQRTEIGIVARINSSIFGKYAGDVIWRRFGASAEPYWEKTDREIQEIVFDEYDQMARLLDT